MATLKETVNNTVISLHRSTGKEWIHLKEIYKEVERVRGEIKNGGASVRAILETQCASSDAFKGDEKYILKEKGSGLYKSVFYNQIKYVENIKVGNKFTREELMKAFKISGQQGIMKSNTLNCLVLTTSNKNRVYSDSTINDGTIIYTGEGLVGDQTLDKNNKTIFDSRETNIPIYLFSKNEKKEYVFEGKVKLYDNPYQVREKDINQEERLVWKFPLEVINDNILLKEEKIKELILEIAQIDDKLNNDEVPLTFIEGKINIRKYNKTEKKIERSSKPDYIAEEIVKTEQGMYNEKVIYENEIKRLMQENALEQVKMMEEFFKNKKENEGFDILTYEINENGEYEEKYIEVKSTKGSESTPIDITKSEIEFAKQHIDNYYLYRIFNSKSKERSLKIVKGADLFNGDYDFIPNTYKIYGKF